LVIPLEQTRELRGLIASRVAMGVVSAEDVAVVAGYLGIVPEADGAVQIPSSEEADINDLAEPNSCWAAASLRGYGSRRGGLLLVFTPGGACVRAGGRNGRLGFVGLDIEEIADALEWQAIIGLHQGAVRTRSAHRTEGWGWYGHASVMRDGCVLLVLQREGD
jgi:hypothetical protein